MFSGKNPKIKGTLSFHLTLLYTTFFLFSSVLTLCAIYFRISTVSMERVDKELVEEIHEFSTIMNNKGLESVLAEIEFEAAEEDLSEIFFRLTHTNSAILAATNMKSWGKLDLSEGATNLSNSKEPYLLETIEIPEQEHQARVISGMIGPSEILQVGISLKQKDKYLAIFRNSFIIVLIPFFIIAAFTGWLISRHAMSDVERVTRTSQEIIGGAYDRRVQLKHRFSEINKLTDTFNNMLDRLQAVMKGMREMTDNIAHDLRSPLTRIRGIAEMTLMNDKKNLSDYKEMAADTVEECDKLINLINTMLDITESEAGVGMVNVEGIHLSEVIHRACDLFHPLLAEKEINLMVNVSEEITIQGNRNKIQRIISNLLDNAIKYTPPGGTIHIAADVEDTRVYIHFKDSGIGISDDDLPHIFNRFYRVDNSRSQPGSGLGLSLAKAFAKSMGGDITVESIQNEGSVFTIIVPNFLDSP